MRHTLRHVGVTAAAALVLTALVTVGTAHAASTGYQITGLPTTLHIVTGSTWQITGTVVDPANANAPVANALVHVGIKEPSTGCGDLTTAACTDLANNGVFAFSDSAGHFTVASANIVGVATLDTLVVLYLDDDGSGPNGSQLDPSTGRSVVVHTHNTYAWAGPVHATMPQSELTSPTSMPAPWDQFSHPHSKVHIATVAGAANPHTEVKRGSGPWRTVATGVNGALPLLSPYGYSPLSLYGSKPGHYSVRIVDTAGTYEDASSSPVVTLDVTKRQMPSWLRRTNAFRHSLGLAPMVENKAYDAGLRKHVHWMHLNNVLSHYEQKGTRGYTKAGDHAGQSSDLAVGRSKPTDNVDTWIGGPFHSVCLLSAWHSVSGFALESGWAGEWCQSQLQAFDVSTGQHLPKVSTVNRAYTFPSSRMKVPTTLLANFNENPDPMTGCTAHSAGTPWSVPVIFRVPVPPASDKHLKHVTAKLYQGSHRIRPTCTITGSTYKGGYPGPQILGDSVSGQWVVLLPRVELKPGKTYHAVLTDGAYRQQTKFTIAKH